MEKSEGSRMRCEDVLLQCPLTSSLVPLEMLFLVERLSDAREECERV